MDAHVVSAQKLRHMCYAWPFMLIFWLKLSPISMLMLFQRSMLWIIDATTHEADCCKAFVVRKSLSCPNLARSVAQQAFGLCRFD